MTGVQTCALPIYVMAFDEESYSLEFLHPFDIDIFFYCLSISDMLSLKDEKLRIGYTHILNDLYKCESYDFDFLNQEYDKHAMFEGLNVSDLKESLEYNNKKMNNMLKKYGTKSKKFKHYLKKDINLFLNYKPRNKKKKAIHNEILTIYNLGFHWINFFQTNSDSWESGTFNYKYMFFSMVDLNDDYAEFYLENIDNQAGNYGVNYPCNTISVFKRKVKDIDTLEDAQQFRNLCESIGNLNSLIQ